MTYYHWDTTQHNLVSEEKAVQSREALWRGLRVLAWHDWQGICLSHFILSLQTHIMSECRKETPMPCAMVAPSTLGAGDLPIIPFLLDVSRVAAVEPELFSLPTT